MILIMRERPLAQFLRPMMKTVPVQHPQGGQDTEATRAAGAFSAD